MKKFTFLIVLSLFVLTGSAQENTDPVEDKMEWFADAKFGIFLHYGIYSVNGITESWSFYNDEISYEDYLKQLDGFTASNYNPQEWAALFKEAGAKYAVLTSKHHDGVALWDTKQSDLSVVRKSPAKKDIVEPYAKALRDEGLKVGIYFSHLDWSHPDYASVHNGADWAPNNINPFDYPPKGEVYPERWERFLSFHRAQLRELDSLVRPDLWWFDGDWSRTAEQWRMYEVREMLLESNPQSILNSRMKGYGDYDTPEQGVPIIPPDGIWELCMTLNDSWGYQVDDFNQKSVNYVIRTLAECISHGGNLLLGVGPTEDGSITPEQTAILKKIGRWTKKHEEAIYETVRGLPFGHYYGPTTISKDRKTLYCFVLDIPKDDLVIKGIKNKVKQIRLVGTDKTLSFERNGGAAWVGLPGVLQVDLQAGLLDEYVTVIAIDLDSPLDLYRGHGGAIEAN